MTSTGRSARSRVGSSRARRSHARSPADPDLLLLDEPTNHLDVAEPRVARARARDDRRRRDPRRPRPLVPRGRHDLGARARRPAARIYFAGPWHEWRREKAARARRSGKDRGSSVRVDIARLERFVERFRYKKSKAKQAQAKLTQIARLGRSARAARQEVASLTKTANARSASTSSNPPRSGRIVLEAEDIALSAGDKQLLDGATVVIERGEKVGASSARTAAGKTTLLAAHTRRTSRRPWEDRRGPRGRAGYFSQHGLELPTSGSVLDATAAGDRASAPAVRRHSSGGSSSRAGNARTRR